MCNNIAIAQDVKKNSIEIEYMTMHDHNSHPLWMNGAFVSYSHILKTELSLGASIGVSHVAGETILYVLPKVEYAFQDNNNIQPFISLRAGAAYGDHGDSVYGIVAMPEAGIRIDHFSVRSGIMYDSQKRMTPRLRPYASIGYTFYF